MVEIVWHNDFLLQSFNVRAMSEAQYVSTGAIGAEDSLSHYGLGLSKYTHFTSPIRRYADVVVHRQLLLTLTSKEETLSQTAPTELNRKVLNSLPESETISIIRGEGIVNTENIEYPTNGTNASQSRRIGSQTLSDFQRNDSTSTDTKNKSVAIYSNKRVSSLCTILNQQNRMAKLSSFECQSLFLSLYFRDNVEVTQAVVTNLRNNGFWVYVPKFDFRAPVYLSDMNGVVQIDPALLALKASSGLDPTTGFASSAIRRFPSGTCTLFELSDDDHLEINLKEATEKYLVRVLDVVTVKIFCDNWNTKSRVPQPKIHLIADSTGKNTASVKKLDQIAVGSDKNENHDSINTAVKMICDQSQGYHTSMYEEIENIITPTKLDVEFRFPENISFETKSMVSSSKNLMTGRVVFGDFTNPDTRSAQQQAAIRQASAAALERRNQVMASRKKENEYDTSRRIESDVTARMQRLAASKRNAKRGKAN